ncbi:S-layer homology domain-containing protein [Halobacillus litoralis]|uniref:S-layer homology domain-containing protein n=1 Tax=Halobacillus litoralis TaxID=45668 RepID=UPI001CFD7519|nr:S-layer homology domain-containing protein [Halobacillus litoralis]WLR49022.1 S-layer homology domain-containing protein [Halobacillus litoralis]
MKKLSILMLFLLFFASFGSAVHAEDDITGTPFEEDLRALIEAGIMTGYEDGTYRPEKSVTRAEFTVFINKALELDETELDVSADQFSDIQVEDWYYDSIMTAYSHGLINGYPDGTFRPKEIISRQDMAVMIMNAADSKNIISERKELAFEDNDKIREYAVESVERLTNLGIISGKQHKDGSLFFAPYDETSRGETAAVINRLLKVLYPPVEMDFKVASLTELEDPVIEGNYETYEEAVKNAEGNQVVLSGNQVVWISEGTAVANAKATIFTSESFTSHATYIQAGIEVELLDVNEESLEVKVADTEGFVKKEEFNLIPSHLIKGKSYYSNKDGNIQHYIYFPITDEFRTYMYGPAPSFMKEGTKYYSDNGNSFYDANGNHVGEAYQYFNRMPLYTETSYTAEQLNEYLEFGRSDNLLIGLGEYFKEAEELHGTNALYLMAHAIHESTWGTSQIAVTKNNLFGIHAIDSAPMEGAKTYDNYETGILDAAKNFIIPNYFNQDSWSANGAHLGNKSSGMNVRWASDPYWGQKIAGFMYRADAYLSEKYGTEPEYGQYELAKTVTSNVNVRSTPETGTDNLLYQMKKPASNVQILNTIEGNGTWYEITPKAYGDHDYEQAFVYSHGYGAYGTSLEKLPIAE